MTSYKDMFISRVDEYDEAVASLLTLGGSVLKYVSNFLISTSSSSSSSSLSSFGKSCSPFVYPSSNLPPTFSYPPPLPLQSLQYRALVIPAPPLWICSQMFFNILYPPLFLLHLCHYRASVSPAPPLWIRPKISFQLPHIHLLFLFIFFTIELW
jgi:hypothetical protein